jgi:hypothetical protein
MDTVTNWMPKDTGNFYRTCCPDNPLQPARLRRGDDNQTCAQREEGRGSTKRPALTDFSKQHCWPQSRKERQHMWCLFYCLRLVNFQNLSTINLTVTMVFSNEFEMISQWQPRMLFPVQFNFSSRRCVTLQLRTRWSKFSHGRDNFQSSSWPRYPRWHGFDNGKQERVQTLSHWCHGHVLWNVLWQESSKQNKTFQQSRQSRPLRPGPRTQIGELDLGEVTKLGFESGGVTCVCFVREKPVSQLWRLHSLSLMKISCPSC